MTRSTDRVTRQTIENDCALHYKSPVNTVTIPLYAGHDLVDPTDVMTDEQMTAVLSGERVTIDVDGCPITMWITET